MENVLKFWRDVEIFNIPDAPKRGRRARAGGDATEDAVHDEAPEDPHDSAQYGSEQQEERLRTHVNKRFPVAASLPLLPWSDPGFAQHAPAQCAVAGAGKAPASYAHVVYLGVGPKAGMVEFILRKHGIALHDDERYRPVSGDGWLAAFIVDAAGNALSRTYVAASFVVGSSLLQANRTLDETSEMLKLRSAEFVDRMAERRQDRAHANPAATSFPLTWDDLLAECEHAHSGLGGPSACGHDGGLGQFIVVESVPLYRKKDGSLSPPVEKAAELFNSFYVDDLTALIQAGPPAYGAALSAYLGPDSTAATRLDLLADPAALPNHAAAALIPPGRWVAPPNEHLALAQQAAVYQIIKRTDHHLMTVNGPPGTGKTTLLKEIVADIVVQWAARLCRLSKPAQLFESDTAKGHPTICADIMHGTGIVVASSNNAAVENISFKMPFDCDRDAFPEASYFPEVSAFLADLFGLPPSTRPWGLVAAPLGAMDNRKKVAKALMGFEAAVDLAKPETYPQAGVPASLKPWLDHAALCAGDGDKVYLKHWHAAKALFEQRCGEVQRARETLAVPEAHFSGLPAEARHRRSLWVTEQLEQARTRLFLAALALHEATVMATAGTWLTLLRALRLFLTGQEDANHVQRIALWRALFFVVPVASTTLASFGRVFQGMQRESLGWVLIDEAGQATPASVAGALWRARRVVLVGDPMQIEPVVTVPRNLVEALAGKRGLCHAQLERWSPSVQSAQTIGERTMPLGAMVGKVWTGLPLRTHRRCMSPMFEIANKVAYDNQMVQATEPRQVFPDLGPSCWIDAPGQSDGKVVDSELKAVRGIIASYLDAWPHVIDANGEKKAASVYVISPFREVADACDRQLGPMSTLGRQCRAKKRHIDVGTVHTFQGKEASIVFLVLGSIPGKAGAGSREWAASKSNLLNVAVTRAQQRLYVIGNYVDWTALQHFCELTARNGMPRMRLEFIEETGQVRLVAAS